MYSLIHKSIFIFIVFMIILANLLVASDQSGDTVPAENKYLWQFIGSWKSMGSITLEGNTSPLEYSFEFERIIDGSGLKMYEQGFLPGFGDFKGFNVIGFDPEEGQVHWFTVSNMGDAHEHTGKWLNPKSLHLEYQSLRQLKNYTESIDFEFIKDDEFKARFLITLGSEQVEKLAGVFKKVNDFGSMTNKKEESMILVRDIFQLKFGKAREAVALWKDGLALEKKLGGGAMRSARILTDIVGPAYYTLVLESVYDSLADFELSAKTAMSNPEWKTWYQNVLPLTEGGHREIFNITE